ncbi:hypothetical protein [Swingsia samuiensis]|nr:hypothetical protein [Swingsia samuiensis]
MLFHRSFFTLSLAAVMAAGVSIAPAQAMTGKECHAAFLSAKKGGTLNGQNYTAFKAANCAKDAKTAKATDVTTASTASSPSAAKTIDSKVENNKTNPETPNTATQALTPVSKTASSPVTSGNVVFPKAVAPEFAKLSAGKARMKTCVAQYNANKENGGNGNLKWIQKGGGYWSQCNSRLKAN